MSDDITSGTKQTSGKSVSFLSECQPFNKLAYHRITDVWMHSVPVHIMRIASRENVDNQAPRNTNFTQ